MPNKTRTVLYSISRFAHFKSAMNPNQKTSPPTTLEIPTTDINQEDLSLVKPNSWRPRLGRKMYGTTNPKLTSRFETARRIKKKAESHHLDDFLVPEFCVAKLSQTTVVRLGFRLFHGTFLRFCLIRVPRNLQRREHQPAENAAKQDPSLDHNGSFPPVFRHQPVCDKSKDGSADCGAAASNSHGEGSPFLGVERDGHNCR